MTSKQMSKLNLKNEEGVTLIELLAAIVILAIIVASYLSFFIQAARTNTQTDSVNEATFIAQEEIEFITFQSTESVNINDIEGITKPEDTYIRSFSESGYTVISKITEPSTDDFLYNVVVTVNDSGGKQRAKMETRLSFDSE